MTFRNDCKLRFICTSTHVANFCRAPVSADNNWRSTWILCRCRSNISCGISRIDGSGILILLLASRTLLVPVDDSVTKSSMILCTIWTRSALNFGLPLRGRSSKLPVSSKCHTKLSFPFNGRGLFGAFSNLVSMRNFCNATVVDSHFL